MPKGALNLKSKGSLFHSLFILLSFILIAIISISVSFFYISTRSSIENDFLINRRHNLEQTKHSLEGELQNIEYAFNAYSTTSSYQSIIENPLNVTSFDQYREITTQMNYFSTPSLYNTSYSLISLNQNWAINEGRLVQLTDEEVEAAYDYYIEGNASSLYWEQADEGMAVVTALPTHSNNKNGIGIAHVSTIDIDQLVNNQEIHFPLLILNTAGELLYDSNYKDSTLTSLLSELSIDSLTEDPLRSEGIPVNIAGEEPFTLLINESSYNNLIYLTALYDYEIHGTLSTTVLGFGILGSLLILFSIGLSWILANYLSRPLRQLKATLNLDSFTESKNDFDYIKSSFETMRTKNDTLQLVLDVEKPALKRQFVLNVFLGKNTVEHLDEKQETYHFPKPQNPIYYVLVSQLDSRTTKDDTLRLFTLLHILEQIIPNNFQFSPVVLSDENVGTILAFESNTTDIDKKIIEYGEQIVASAKEEANLLVSVGLSPSYACFNHTRSAYKKAKKALSYKMLLGNQSIIAYEDIQEITADSHAGYYFSELEEPIFQAIQLGNIEEARKQTYPFLATLFKNNPDPLSIEFALLRFFMNLSKLDQSLETRVINRSLIEEYYQTILFHRNLVDIEETLVINMIIPMAEQIKSRTNEQFKQVSQRIKAKIQKDFEEDLSLDTISEELNYNPNYLSSIFKKETGTTFSDYLIEFRLNKAKEWLRETDLTVKEIAEKLRYGNSQNFIRSFKKRESITPGQYRKEHKVI